jgi:hypothetical protein
MAEFDPDAFLKEPSKKSAAPSKGFDPDAFLQEPVAKTKPVTSNKRTEPVSTERPKTSAIGTFAREAGLNVPATMAGIGAGEAATVAAAPVLGPAAPLAGLVAGGAVGFGVNYIGEKGLDALEGSDPLIKKFMTMVGADHATREAGRREHEYAALAGQLASGGPFMSTAAKSLGQRAMGGGIQAGVGVGTRAAMGEEQDWKKTALEFAGGAAMPGGLTKTGEKIPGVKKPVEPVAKPTVEPTTPEERAALIEKIKAESAAKAPLVETALRNKETGELERMGPKHDQARKDATKDTHEEGFVDAQGNFHERQAAVDQAKRAGQIPEDHVLENPPGEREGLHSGDMRKAGVKDFEVSETNPAGVPSNTRPVTLDDTTPPKFLYHGTKAEPEFDAQGNLVLRPAQNFEGKTSSVSLTHNQDVATDYAARIKGGGPGAFDFANAKTIKIHSDALPEGISRESGEEWAFNTTDPIVIPKDKFEIVEHPLSKETSPEARKAEADRLEAIADKRGTRTYEEPAVEWNKPKKAEPAVLKDGSKVSIETESSPNAFSNIVRMQYGEPISLIAKNKAGEEIGRLTYMPDGGPIDISVREQDRRKGVATALYDAHEAAGGKLPAVDSGVAISDEARAVRAAREAKLSTDTIPKVAKEPTTTDPRNIGSDEEMLKVATEIYEKSGEKAAIEFYEGYKEYKKTWLEPIKETEKFVGTNLNNKLAAERVISNNKADVLELAKEGKVNLEQLTYKIDKGETLTGAEKTIADKFRSFMDALGKRALDAGVINGWHEDYVARNVVSEGNAPKGALEEFLQDIFGRGEPSAMGGVKTTTKYGEPRRLKTREDLLNHLDGINGWLAANGKDYRFKLKTDNLAEIYADYAHSVEKAIENKNLVTNLKQVRNANGESLIRPITESDPLPHGWEVMNTSELAGYAIHPDLMPALKFVFDSGPGKLVEALGNISQVTKRINVIGSFFHAKSLMEVMSSAQIPIWTPVKEAIVLPLVEKGVKALTGKELQLSAISKAVDQFQKGGVGDNVDRWIKEGGLQLEAPEDVSKNILSATGKFADEMIGKFGPKTRVLEKSLSTVEKYTLGLFDKYTWDYLHTGGKIMVADAYLDKARIAAAKEGKPFDEKAARVEISRFVNDSFGGLNWFDAATSARTEMGKRIAMAAYSPAGRRGLQIALFAPDWTISTLRAFSSALPSGLNPAKWHPVEGVKGMMVPTTKADYARLYQFKTALTYLTLINAINMMTANRPIWDNKDPTRIEWPDGTSMQAMKHAMEPYHWIADPDKTLANKLGFIPKAVIIGIAGTEYASPQAQKLVDPSATGRLKAVAGTVVPFQVAASRDAPPGEGLKRAALGTAGFPVYGATKEQKKAARAEREKALKQKAREYHEKAKEKGWE